MSKEVSWYSHVFYTFGLGLFFFAAAGTIAGAYTGVTPAVSKAIVFGGWILTTVLAVMIPILMSVRQKRRKVLRQQQIQALAAAHKYNYSTVTSQEVMHFQSTVLNEMAGQNNMQSTNFVVAPEWTYADFFYHIYGRTRSGQYIARTIYYGVMTAQLPRSLPHVFFDSQKARGRQFNLHFAAAQKHELEGNFGKHFTTYFPKEYTIDSLSFISPDVMQSLVAADEYDIEIVGDRLFLYGPLFQPDEQISDMVAKLNIIKKELLDNIRTYRDERLPFSEGRLSVAPLGVSLKRSNFRKRIGWIITGFWILFILVIFIINIIERMNL